MNIDSFRIDDTAPYMYTNINGPTNISGSTVADASFRAIIVGK